jgi:hypothetical protein
MRVNSRSDVSGVAGPAVCDVAIAAAALLLLLSNSAIAQVPAQAPNDMARRQAIEVAGRVALEKPVKGAPYSADTVVESTQTLADGNHITNKTTGHVYRDGEGRIRREDERNFSVLTADGAKTAKTVTVSIIDPVGGASYMLDAEHQVAWKTPLTAGGMILDKLEASEVDAKRKAELDATKAEMIRARGGRAREGGPGEAGAAMKQEFSRRGFAEVSDAPLEHRTVEGLAVEGRKTTHVIPAGQMGNELPLTITSEEWSSPELKVLVMTHHSDPRTGESSYRLTNIVRAEPDPSLFQVPPGYTIKETGISKLEPAMRRR